MTTILKSVYARGLNTFIGGSGKSMKVTYIEPGSENEAIPHYVEAQEFTGLPGGCYAAVMPEKDFWFLHNRKGLPGKIGGKPPVYFLPEESEPLFTDKSATYREFYSSEAGEENVRIQASKVHRFLIDGFTPVFCLPAKKSFLQKKSKAKFYAATALVKLTLLSLNCGLRIVRNGDEINPVKLIEYNIDLRQTLGWEPDRFAQLIAGYFSLMKTRSRADFNAKLDALIKDLVKPVSKKRPVSLKERIRQEIEALPEERRLFSQGEFEVVLTTKKHCPSVLNEIGILREITFREVGEGTGKAADIDEFDAYYEHLVLWDSKNNEIAGAYRIGFGDQIIERYGVNGFYTSTLFTYEPGFEHVLSKTMELGRSFIVSAYRGKRLPLFLLWKGIYQVFNESPNMQFLLGAASISNVYSPVSRKLMVDYLTQHYENEYLSPFIFPNVPCLLKLNKKQRAAVAFHNDYVAQSPESLIKSIDPQSGGMPVLIKRYLQQNASVLGINVDIQFSRSIDVLMLLDKNHIPGETHKNLKVCENG